MTENWLEYDRKKITPTNMNDGTWPKDYTDEHERLNMTEIPTKMTEIFNFGHIHSYRLVVLVFLSDFLILVIFNRSCSSLSCYFGHVQKVNVHPCDLFGHVQIFGHIHSVILNQSYWHSSSFLVLLLVLTCSFKPEEDIYKCWN